MAIIPSNCLDCAFCSICTNTYYGGSLCKYQAEIAQLATKTSLQPIQVKEDIQHE